MSQIKAGEVHDLIVVGGGLAGLTAAYHQRDKDVIVLEAAERLGGRILSLVHDEVPLNLGAHMFGGAGTPVGDLLEELGLKRQPIKGQLFGMRLGRMKILKGRPELWPLLSPLSLKERVSFIKMGLRLRRGARRMARVLAIDTGQRISAAGLSFEDKRTLVQFMGPLHPKIEGVLAAITERSGGDPDTMSAGHALRSFTNVWSDAAPGANLEGGSAQLIDRLTDAINGSTGGRTHVNVSVSSVEAVGELVCVQLNDGKKIFARHCVVATPAPKAAQIVRGMPTETYLALNKIAYGTFACVAMLLKNVQNAPWSEIYAISTPGFPFSVTFNQSTGLPEAGRRGDSSLMLFRGGKGAERISELNDDDLKALAAHYLHDVFPEARYDIAKTEIARWSFGAPVALPERAELQEALERPLGRIALAGDYMESPNMNSAVTSAQLSLERLGLG